MDNYLSSEFGNLGLSSTAREWKPPGAPGQQQQQSLHPQQQQQQQPQLQLQAHQLHQQAPPPQQLHPQQRQHQQLQPQPQRQRQPEPLEQSRHILQSNSRDWQQNEPELAYSVKEFVPGHGWTPQQGPSSAGAGLIGNSGSQGKKKLNFYFK
jgi:hypothetical protein